MIAASAVPPNRSRERRLDAAFDFAARAPRRDAVVCRHGYPPIRWSCDAHATQWAARRNVRFRAQWPADQTLTVAIGGRSRRSGGGSCTATGAAVCDERRRAEDRRRGRVEVRQPDGRRRNQWLLGAPGAATLAAGRKRQVAVLVQLRRVETANHQQVRQQPCDQDHRHDPTMPKSQPSNALYHTSLSFRAPTPHNGRSARSC